MLEYHHYIENLALLVGCFLFKMYWPIQFKLLIVLAGISVIVELYGAYLTNYKHVTDNGWLYNIYLFFQGPMIALIAYNLLITPKLRKLQLLLLILFVLFVSISHIYVWNFLKFNNYAAVAILVVSCMCCSLFFIDVMINSINIPLFKQPGFWFIIGTLAFSVLLICRFALWHLAPRTSGYIKTIIYLTNAANTFMYLGFIATFICLHVTRRR